MRWTELGSAVQMTIIAIFVLLVISTLITITLCRLRPEGNWERLTRRIHTWWILSTVFFLAIVAGRTSSIVFFAFASFLALKEFLTLTPTRRSDRRVLFWAYLAIPFQYFWVYTEWYGLFIVFIPVYMFLLLPVRMISIGQTAGFLRAAGTLHWGLMTMVFSLSHAAFLLVLRLADDPDSLPGPGLVLYLVVLTQLNDVAQFLCGHLYGRRRVAPNVDRRKTWTAFLGGAATTVVLAVLAGPYLTPMSYAESVVAGLIIGFGGIAGDLCMSAVKRDLQVTSSGFILPGHGGVLDRLDSLTYTAPLFFHYVYWLFAFHTHGA